MSQHTNNGYQARYSDVSLFSGVSSYMENSTTNLNEYNASSSYNQNSSQYTPIQSKNSNSNKNRASPYKSQNQSYSKRFDNLSSVNQKSTSKGHDHIYQHAQNLLDLGQRDSPQIQNQNYPNELPFEPQEESYGYSVEKHTYGSQFKSQNTPRYSDDQSQTPSHANSSSRYNDHQSHLPSRSEYTQSYTDNRIQTQEHIPVDQCQTQPLNVTYRSNGVEEDHFQSPSQPFEYQCTQLKESLQKSDAIFRLPAERVDQQDQQNILSFSRQDKPSLIPYSHLETTYEENTTHINPEPETDNPVILAVNPLSLRVFKCEVCNASFKRKFNMKQHMKTHDNRKEFSCDVCEALFTRKQDLARHATTHVDCAYKCETCQMTFTRFDSLTRHRRAVKFGKAPQCVMKP